MLALTLALATTALDAERAFARMAQDQGQWTAFRAYAAPDAVMFVPQPVKAQEWLRDRRDPPKSLRWQPTKSFVSCDGTLSVNTGNWQSADGKSVGYFTTVWQRQADGGWKWVYDGGDELKVARTATSTPIARTASCANSANHGARIDDSSLYGQTGDGRSVDKTLEWGWVALRSGARSFNVELWNGSGYEDVLLDQVGP